MAKVFLRSRLAELGCPALIATAGFVGEGSPPPAEVLAALERRGLSLGGHRSRVVSPRLVGDADLAITMTRQQLIDLAIVAGTTWTKAFTFVDLLRRAEVTGARAGDEEVSTWVGRLHSGRKRAGLLNLPLEDDIEDPMGGRPSAFERVASEIEHLTDQLADLLCPPSPPA